MTYREPSIFMPVLLPNDAEIKACRFYEPQVLPRKWKELAPAVLRKLIYREIGGANIFPTILGTDARLEHELLILAELQPPVWGVTRDIDHQVWMHLYGICLGCNTEIDFSEGREFAFVRVCNKCIRLTNRIQSFDRSFKSSIDQWPITYQHECINYLIDTIVPLEEVTHGNI